MQESLVFCMAGSSKFKAQHRTVERALTFAGHVVLPLVIYSKSESLYIAPDQETTLVEVWKKKCDLCDYVCVIAPDGYIGDHTKGDITYALSHHKKIISVPSDFASAIVEQVPGMTADDIITLKELGREGQVSI